MLTLIIAYCHAIRCCIDVDYATPCYAHGVAMHCCRACYAAAASESCALHAALICYARALLLLLLLLRAAAPLLRQLPHR